MTFNEVNHVKYETNNGKTTCESIWFDGYTYMTVTMMGEDSYMFLCHTFFLYMDWVPVGWGLDCSNCLLIGFFIIFLDMFSGLLDEVYY